MIKYKRFKETREQQGISIWRMSRKLHINPIKYWYIEQHIKHVNCEDFVRISEILGITVIVL